MAAITYENLSAHLKKRDFAPVYLLMGEEPFYIDQVCKFFENKVVDEADRDFNQVVLYGKDTDAAEVVANAKQYPFGSQYRLVIVKEAKEIRDFSLIEQYVQNPMESTILVICYKYGTIKKLKPFEAKGIVFNSAAKRDYELPQWIQKQAAYFRFQMDEPTSVLLAEHLGNDLSRIFKEFEKLQVVLPANSIITPDVVETHIGISKEYNWFELQEALGFRNVSKAYKIMLNFAKNTKEHPLIPIIAQMFKFYHGMLRYHLLQDRSQQAVNDCFGSKSSFYVNKLVGYARRYNVPQLTKAIAVLREYDAKSKGVDTVCSDEELYKEMIFKILH